MSELALPRARARAKRKRQRGPLERLWWKALLIQLSLVLFQVCWWVWFPPEGGVLVSWRVACVGATVYFAHSAYRRWSYCRDEGL